MTKLYAENTDLQQKILNGVNKLADNVAATLGPKGRNVILSKGGDKPIITKDGVTVANFVELEEPFEHAAASLLKQAASETNNIAGDGTTTSTVLAREILRNSQKYLVAGSSPVEMKKGMDKAVTQITNKIKEDSQSVESTEDVQHVATISANGDEHIGKLIAKAASQVGHDGSILVQAAGALETSLDLVEGFRFPSGYFSQSFVTDERRNAVTYEDALFFVTDHKIDNVKAILPVLELAARENKPLVLVAENVEGQALAALIMNSVRGSMKVVAVKAPGYGKERINLMKDLCLATGAKFMNRALGASLDSVKLVDFGLCKKIEVLKNETTIMGGAADWEKIDEKIDALKSEIKQTEDVEECRKIQQRITRLSSGVAIINVGGLTEVEMTEKKHRIEDALAAVKSAQEEGIVPGGGIALLRCQNFSIKHENEDQLLGADIIRRSLEAPIRQMSANCAESADIIINKIRSSAKRKKDKNMGWDFKNSKIVDMMQEGIVDPAKVTRVALQNAVSVSSILITTSNAIVGDNK
jgi:chaperonin GroEL